MSEQFQNKIPTGTFAKLCGIPKKTLLYYDEIGLFQPDFVAENGYRYYSYRQFEVISVILGLRGLGMPLREIKTYIHNRTPEKMIRLLEEQNRNTQNEIKRLKLTGQFLQTRIALTKSVLNQPTEEIQLQRQEKTYFLVTGTGALRSKYDFAKAWRAHIQRCIEKQLNAGYPDGTIVQVDDIMRGNYEKYAYIFTKTERPIQGEQFFEKPQGLYLTAYHKGAYEHTGETYCKMVAFAKEQGLALQGYAFEEGLLDDLVTSSPERLLTKISIEVGA